MKQYFFMSEKTFERSRKLFLQRFHNDPYAIDIANEILNSLENIMGSMTMDVPKIIEEQENEMR
ncbi:MAG: hypothetical protein KC483_10855 [Nitrosarchaeum sp.]|nr:hypothetical protein [Nitrosarchaeum sp.]